MAVVAVVSAVPSVQVGLATILAQHGHQVVAGESAPSGAVWLLDAPDPAALALIASRCEATAPPALVVLLDDPSWTVRIAALRMRGWACLGRESSPDEIDLAVRAADAGLVLMDLPAAGAVARPSREGHPREPSGVEPLSPRECQVLELVAEGLPNKAIARALGITENTAKFHVASICAKLGAATRTEAVTVATRQGLLVL
jgi:DNA-binding NarL/FixJ family response regulator